MAESESSPQTRQRAAAGKVNEGLLELRRHLDQARLAAGDTGAHPAAAASRAADVFKGDQLLDALQACAHRLVSLRDTLLAQAEVSPRRACWAEGREDEDLVVAEAGHKAQSALLHAQQIATDVYHEALAELDDAAAARNGSTPGQRKVLDTVKACDSAGVATAIALNAVIGALSDPPSSPSKERPGSVGGDMWAVDGMGGTQGFGGLGGGGSGGGAGSGRPKSRGRIQPSTTGPFGKGEFVEPPGNMGTTDRSGVALAGAAPGAAAAKVGKAGVVRSGGASSNGVFYPGIHRTASARSCRSQGTRLKPGEALARRTSAAARGGAPMTATEEAKALGLDPVTREGVEAAAAKGKRTTPSRAALSRRGACGLGPGQGSAAMGFQGGREAGWMGGEVGVRGTAAGREALFVANGKLSPAEQQPSGTASAKSARFGRASAATASSATRTSARACSGAAGAAPAVGSRQKSRHEEGRSSTSNNNNNGALLSGFPGSSRAFRESFDDLMAHGYLEDASLSAFLEGSSPPCSSSPLSSPRRCSSAKRATAASTSRRRQDLLELHSAAGGGRRGGCGGGGDGGGWTAGAAALRATDQRRSASSGRLSSAAASAAAASAAAASAAAVVPQSHSSSIGAMLAAETAAVAAAAAGDDGDGTNVGTPWHTPGMDEDEAAARRFAKQEQEAQAREDELLALRLAAREEASAERRAARHRRSARRNSAPGGRHGLDNRTAAAAALAAAAAITGGGRGGGDAADGVSDAVRALQFQDIEANDYETLLALDEGGGAGGRCCAGGRGLTEEAVEEVLRPERAEGQRLEESCAICMSDFELGDEISVLPCTHAFHDACIRKWLSLRNRCPTDMQPVVPESPKAA